MLFETELEVQREIADLMITRPQEFHDGERVFEDAMTCEEFVVGQCELRRIIHQGNGLQSASPSPMSPALFP